MNLARRLLLSTPNQAISQKECTQGHHSQPDFRNALVNSWPHLYTSPDLQGIANDLATQSGRW